jgi:hypothetical protein
MAYATVAAVHSPRIIDAHIADIALFKENDVLLAQMIVKNKLKKRDNKLSEIQKQSLHAAKDQKFKVLKYDDNTIFRYSQFHRCFEELRGGVHTKT